ncbi:MAG: NAD(P)(+) transhydrogenase (Re/Si-specific) subunit beta [Rickettsiaceae bacterium]|nr:NAD(P)(+) transhydrogenase (Re/Si-specific) subunit beta [Rickettsiaceae bacterium]
MGKIISIIYLISSICFILSLKGLSSPTSARRGNFIGMVGMALAIGATFLHANVSNYPIILLAIALGGIIGVILATRVKMTAMPELVAGFHSLVGLAAVLVAIAAFLEPNNFGILGEYGILTGNLIEMTVGAIVGAITFTGSVIAFLKLRGSLGSKPMRFRGRHIVNLALFGMILYGSVMFVSSSSLTMLLLIIALSFLLGILLIIPIGGADMPVIVSMLNSYSGWAAAGIGFTLENSLLIITGALVGSSGAILSYIMCKAMNRSIINVIFGGFGSSKMGSSDELAEDRVYRAGSAEDAAYMLSVAERVIIVPGYGMAVAGAQHAIKQLVDILKSKSIDVRFAIHPVAGRMPGHMNVLLAEAKIDYEEVYELEEINNEFQFTDVTIVVGANDVTNPAAKNDESSPIYGMPILDVSLSRNIFFIKRGMASGYAGIENELFYQDNTTMLFGDAKEVVEEIIKSLK